MATWPELVADEIAHQPVREPEHNESGLVFVRGHRLRGGGIEEFPHLCPGANCAIGAWLQQTRGGRFSRPL